MTGDEFAGVTRVDNTTTASGTATEFSSGPSGTTAAAREVVFGAVAVPNGSVNPTWATGWKDMGSYAVGTRYLGRGYQLSTSTSSFTASGTASGSWMASVVTFMP